MASPFDTAWAASDAALAVVMGEVVVIGGVEFTVVVPAVSSAAGIAGGQVRIQQSGIDFLLLISAEEMAAKAPEKAARELHGLRVKRGAYEGRVVAEVDLGGAGVELSVGPLGGR